MCTGVRRVFIAAVLLGGLAVGPAAAQPPAPPTVTAGLGLALNCPGTNDGIPELACTRWGEATPGVHPRAFVDLRPHDRVLISLTAGTLRFPGRTYEATGATPQETWLVARRARTSWHVAATAAYVGGATRHAVQGFIGGGWLAYRDPVELMVTGASPPPAWLTDAAAKGGVGTVLTAGALIRGGRQWHAKVAYMLASQMADPHQSDGGWRHELSVGVGWGIVRP